MDGERNPHTRATVNQMLHRYLEMIVIEVTLDPYTGQVWIGNDANGTATRVMRDTVEPRPRP